ncbi:MAG TPA: response regulator [Lysobacter sp.]|nr:response regulator [Lysobacter sp.]
MGNAETKHSILLVEDEVLLALMLEDLLLDSGYRVTRATGLTDALELVERTQFDVAILDVNLGGIEVFPLATRLQELRIPFLFASAGDAAHIGSKFGDHPMISKPYTIDEIQQSLGELLGTTSRTTTQ